MQPVTTAPTNTLLVCPKSALAVKAQQGCQDSKTELFKQVKGIIAKIALKYARNNTDFDDYFQAGCLGFLSAVAKYNPTSGKFVTYAFWSIMESTLRCFKHSTHLVYVPRNNVGKTEIYVAYFADKMFGGAHNDDTERTVADTLPPSDEDIFECVASTLISAAVQARLAKVKCLSKVDRAIIEHRLIGGETLEAVGQRVGVTRERVRQKEIKLVTTTLPRILADLDPSL